MISIGLFGGSFCCPNFGVGALTISQCNILNNIAKDMKTKFDIICYEAKIQNSYLRTFENLNISLDTHTLNVAEMRRKFARHDLVIDMYGGDSFSDIYSKKGFALGCSQRLFSIGKTAKYVLAPQTIGPFSSKTSIFLARKLLKRANHIFLRDSKSMECIPTEMQTKTDCVTDMAFMLPYDKNRSTTFKIGLNVSGLLWHSALLEDKTQEYRNSIHKIIQYCIDSGIHLTLVPHVNDAENSIDGDYAVSEQLFKDYSNRIHLAPPFKDPVEAKTYISQFQFFIGSRMHATIASTSMGIPTMIIAYSKKFEGLFNALGYSYIIDKTDIRADSVLDVLINMLENIDEITAKVEILQNVARQRLKLYGDYLKVTIKELENEKHTRS